MEKLPVTLKVSTRNAATLLPACFDSCKDWVSEIVVVDMESDDDTLEVARSYGAKIVSVEAAGFAEPGRQRGIEAASQPWVLVLDADELAGPKLHQLVAKTVTRNDINGLALPRKNIILHKWVRHSSYWPDFQMRLFRSDRANWPPKVHTQVEIDGPTERAPAKLDYAIVHEHYKTLKQLVANINIYSDFDAERFESIGRKPSVARMFAAPPARFLNSYVRYRGFMGGFRGFALAVLMSYYAVLIELKLWERQRIQGD